MLLVKTKIRPSKIAGVGLFADECIPKGALVWKFSSTVDIAEPSESGDLYHAYISKQTGRRITPGDDAKYINHSTTPNLDTRYESGIEEDINFALRDIRAGEELTIDYTTFAQEGADFSDS
jgi:SET domain-containing protein